MSNVLKQLEPDYDDFDDDDDYSEDGNYSDEDREGEEYSEEHEQEEEGEEEEAEQEVVVDFLELAKKKKQQQKNNKNPLPKIKSQPVKKTYKLDDELSPNAMIKFGDIKEKEYYDNLLLDESDRKEKAKALNSVNFTIPVRESVMMNFDSVKPTSFTIVTVNEKWKEVYLKQKNDLRSINDKRLQEGKKALSPYDLMRNIFDANGNRLSRFNRQQLSGDHSDTQNCFKRTMFAAAHVNGKIWVHGGTNGKSVFSDFWSYDTSSGHLTWYKNINHEPSFALDIPRMCEHQMIPVSKDGVDGLLIMGHDHRALEWGWSRERKRWQDMQFFYIHDISKADDFSIHYGVRMNITDHGHPSCYYLHPKAFTPETAPPLCDFSATLMGVGVNMVHNILIFGGRQKGSSAGTSTLTHVTFDPTASYTHNSRPTPYYHVTRILKPKSVRSFWPAPRYGHSATSLNGNLLIFGGRDGSTYYSDLWFFNTETRQWTEIDVTGAVPPGLAYSGCFAHSLQTVLFYGGMTNGGASNSLYSYDTGAKAWSIVKVRGHGSSRDSSAERMQTPCYGAQTIVSGYHMFRIGGKRDAQALPEMTTLSNIQDPGHGYSICEYLRRVKAEGVLTDVVFRVREKLDSEKTKDQLNDADAIREFQAHRAILFARCKYLMNLVNESTNIVEFEPEDPTEILFSTTKTIVDVEDCNASVFEAYLNFLYTGELILSGLEQLSALTALCEQWCPDTHYPLIAELCNPSGRVQLTIAEAVIAQLEKDLETLVDNPDSFTDLTLVLGCDEDSQSLVYVHKFILCRSEYFKNMLSSGMQESYAEIIELPDFNRDIMLEILRYCYTDKIHLTMENAVGSLIYASMFNLPDICNSCRNLVGQCLTLDNVCAVMEVAETYSDSSLKRTCLPFMRDNFEDLAETVAFQNLSSDTKNKLIEMVNKKKKYQKK